MRTAPGRRAGGAMRRLLWVVLVLSACQTELEPLALKERDVVKVSGIVKGDEVTVEREGRVARLRLPGLHAFAPVINDAQVSALSAGGESALTDLAKHKDATIHLGQTPQDSTGRYLAYVAAEGVD